jgi:hypothetical protein
MPVKAKTIISWIDKELPPLSWGVISIKLMKTFMKNGVSPRAIDDDVVFNDEMVAEIRELVKNTYNKEIPTL